MRLCITCEYLDRESSLAHVSSSSVEQKKKPIAHVIRNKCTNVIISTDRLSHRTHEIRSIQNITSLTRS